MNRTHILSVAILCVLLLGCGTSLTAGRFERLVGCVKRRCRAFELRVPGLRCRCENDEQRAGQPRCIAPWARCFPNAKYTGFYSGGGATFYGSPPTRFRGEPRYADEGTFGLDYDPWYSRVRLQWFHRNQH
ncbi:MAG: hypothetical protein ABGZ17_32010 [Planctomycetaceae bacterium]